MKIFDFSKRNLTEMPLISENSVFEYILDNNSISQIEIIPITCQKLSISNNKISNLNSKLEGEFHLKILDISFNRIISLVGFNKFFLLSELNLSNNYISDDQLQNLKSLLYLKTLNLSNNNLKSGEISNLIANLKSIEKVNISNNNIENLEFKSKCDTLLQLEIDLNKLTNLSFENKYTFPNLMYLSINGNKLNNFPSVNNLCSLEYLSISENEIKNFEITNLKNLKFLQLKGNLLTSNKIQNCLQYIQFYECSYNNLNNFIISGNHNNISNLLLDNNKLMNIDFEEKNNFCDNVELLDLSYNLFVEIKFIENFTNLQKLNLSFNQLRNLNNIVNHLEKIKSLRELNLIENDFNRNLYNLEVVPNEIFNTLKDYFNHPNVKNLNKNKLISYRNYLILAIENLNNLDMIGVSIEEKSEVIKNNSNYNNSVYSKKNPKLTNSTRNDNNNNNNNSLRNKFKESMNNNHKNNIINNIQIPNFSSSLSNQYNIKDKFKTINSNNLSINDTENNYISEFEINENIKNTYNILKQTFINICDSNGFIIYKDYVQLANELSLIYNIENYFNEINKEIKYLIKNSLLPNKFHIRDFIKIIKNLKYQKMFFIIEKKLKENPNILSKSLHFSSQNFNNLHNGNENDMNKLNTIIKDIDNTNYNYNQDYDKLNINYDILNQRILKTPLLTNQKNFSDNSSNHNKEITIQNLKPMNQNKNKCFNFLYQSNSELNNSPDLNNKNFLMNFLYFINHISFPLKYYDINQSFLITITEEEKEYKFLKAFINNFNIKNFTLEKWYCHEYYHQVFSNYFSIEFLFENNLLLFYSYYNEIIDNFFNDIYQIKECFLMIEENPNNLINKNSESNKIVMYALVQKKNLENNVIDNIVYNKNDDKFYFKNPFDWIGNSDSIEQVNKNFVFGKNNNSNILVPIYVINILN